MNEQRILHVINKFDHVGKGIVNIACDPAYAQARVLHAVGVASLDGSYVDLLQPEGVEHLPLGLNDRGAGGIYRAQRDLGRILA